MWNPCCGQDIHRAAKIVAVFDVVFSIAELGAAFVFESGPVTILSTDSTDPEKRDVNFEVSMSLLFAICLVMMRIVQLGCSILLLYGVVERNYRKCGIWLLFSVVVVGLAVLQILFEIYIRDKLMGSSGSGSTSRSHPLLVRLIIPGLELLLMWYFILVITVFMRHLRKSQKASGNGNKDPLSPEEREMISKI